MSKLHVDRIRTTFERLFNDLVDLSDLKDRTDKEKKIEKMYFFQEVSLLMHLHRPPKLTIKQRLKLLLINIRIMELMRSILIKASFRYMLSNRSGKILEKVALGLEILGIS